MKKHCEAHLTQTFGDIFAAICWCLNDRDLVQVATVTKAMQAKLVYVGNYFSGRSELLLHEDSNNGVVWCNLSAQEVATYLRAIAPLSATVENIVSIRQRSICPPLLARRMPCSRTGPLPRQEPQAMSQLSQAE